jgi:hypothetical protein
MVAGNKGIFDDKPGQCVHLGLFPLRGGEPGEDLAHPINLTAPTDGRVDNAHQVLGNHRNLILTDRLDKIKNREILIPDFTPCHWSPR